MKKIKRGGVDEVGGRGELKILRWEKWFREGHVADLLT